MGGRKGLPKKKKKFESNGHADHYFRNGPYVLELKHGFLRLRTEQGCFSAGVAHDLCCFDFFPNMLTATCKRISRNNQIIVKC
jgi:hypothetical protein